MATLKEVIDKATKEKVRILIVHKDDHILGLFGIANYREVIIYRIAGLYNRKIAIEPIDENKRKGNCKILSYKSLKQNYRFIGRE